MKFMVDAGAFAPTKGYKSDAGYDLKTNCYFEIPARGMALIDTGIHVEIPDGYVGMLKSKSGINVNRNCVTEGVIDSGYTGSIKVKMYNLGDSSQLYEPGDKITQLVVIPFLNEEIEIVDGFKETERGNNGFGSTGK